MNIDFELYRIFFVTAEAGSITNASKELFISQPAVTKQIQKLETILGCNLFIRTKKGLILTEVGKSIYIDIKNGIKSFEIAEQKIKGLKQLEHGIIKIGIGTTLTRKFLLPYLKEFHENYPNIKIEIQTDPYSELKEKLKHGKVDFVISKIPDVLDEDLESTKLGEINECFVASEKFIELKDKTILKEELPNYPILLQTNTANIRRYFDKYCEDNNIIITSLNEIASSSLLIDFVKAGFGIGVVTKEYIKEDLEKGVLYELKVEPHIPTRSFGLITLKNSILSYATTLLIKQIQSLKYKM